MEKKGGGVVMNQREWERGDRGEYRSQAVSKNTNRTECTQEIGYLQSVKSLCVELEKTPLITFILFNFSHWKRVPGSFF